MSFISNRRKKIDEIDSELVKLLDKRFKIVNGVKKWKKENKLKMEDKTREKEIKSHYMGSNISKTFINKFFYLLFREAKK